MWRRTMNCNIYWDIVGSRSLKVENSSLQSSQRWEIEKIRIRTAKFTSLPNSRRVVVNTRRFT